MYKLQDETRAQAVARFNRDGGSEADYIRSVPVKMADGTAETLTHCEICLAHLENGFIKHLHYCPFEGAADRLKEAAPALLKACEAALRYIGLIPLAEIDWRNADEIIEQIETAIAAVRGEVDVTGKVVYHYVQ